MLPPNFLPTADPEQPRDFLPGIVVDPEAVCINPACAAGFADMAALHHHMLEHAGDDSHDYAPGIERPAQFVTERETQLAIRAKRDEFITRLAETTGFTPREVVDMLKGLT